MNPFIRPFLVTLVSLFGASLVQAQIYSLTVEQKNSLYHRFNGAGTGTVAATAATAYGPPGSASLPISNTLTLPATANSNKQK